MLTAEKRYKNQQHFLFTKHTHTHILHTAAEDKKKSYYREGKTKKEANQFRGPAWCITMPGRAHVSGIIM